MNAMHRTLTTLLIPALSLALATGCDKGKSDDGKKSAGAKTDKDADDKADKEADKKAEAPPEPEKPEGPVFTAKGAMGDEVSLPLVAFDLEKVGLAGFTIQVPEGTSAMEKSPSGHKLINSRVNYSITVSEGEFDKEGAKKTYGILDPDGKVVDESDTHIIYQRSGEGGFLFQAGTKVGDKSLNCGTVASISPFTRRQIDQSVESCKSIAAAEGGGDAAAEGGGDAAKKAG